MTTEVYITGGVRTAIGTFGGALSGVAPGDTGAAVIGEALDRAGADPQSVGHVVMGQVIPTGPEDAYLARVTAIGAGVPQEAPAMTLNRLCGSGVQAIVSAAQSIMLGDCEVAVAGGAEAMSRAPHVTRSARFGQKMGNLTMVDYLQGILTDPFGNGIMGVTAENVAERYQISREDQDAFAVESQRRAKAAQDAGHFAGQILPMSVKLRRKEITFDTDEHPKPETTSETLAKLRTIYREGGSVTAGNASGINDGAAAVVLMSETAMKEQGVVPRARIIGYAHAGVEPGVMGIGPVPAVRDLLARTGMKLADFDVIESNEAFAAQGACRVARAGLRPRQGQSRRRRDRAWSSGRRNRRDPDRQGIELA